MTFRPIWVRYGTAWGQRFSSMYRRPFKFLDSSLFKFIPAHIITHPPLYAVVCWTVGSKCLFPLRRHTRMRPSTFRRQNLDSPEKRTCDHCCLYHLLRCAQNWRFRALWRWESWGFLAGFLELNQEAKTLFLTICTEMRLAPGPCCCLNILSRLGHPHSVALLQWLQCIGLHAGLSRSGSVRNSPRCSMTIMKSNKGSTMNVELVNNILWVNARLYTTQSPGSFFIRKFRKFSQSSKRPCICHNNIDNSNAKNAVGYVIGKAFVKFVQIFAQKSWCYFWSRFHQIIPCRNTDQVQHFVSFDCRPMVPLYTCFWDISRVILIPFHTKFFLEMGLNADINHVVGCYLCLK